MNLDELKSAALAATPGPWEEAIDGGSNFDMQHGVYAKCNDLWIAACYRSGVNQDDDKSEAAEIEVAANAQLIAAANPATVLKLIRVVEAARSVVEDYSCTEKILIDALKELE